VILSAERLFVADHDLVVVADVGRLKQIELNRSFAALNRSVPDKDESIAPALRLRCPPTLEEAVLAIDSSPALAVLNQLLEFSKSLERHRQRKPHVRIAQLGTVVVHAGQYAAERGDIGKAGQYRR